MRFIENILNIGTKSEHNKELIRQYRQANGLAVAMFLICFFGAVTAFIIQLAAHIYIWTQVISFLFLYSLYLTYKNNLNFAKKYTITICELNSFCMALCVITKTTDNSLYFELTPLFIIFPLFAAVLDMSIIWHTFIGLLCISILYLVAWLFPQNIDYIVNTFKPGGILPFRLTMFIVIIIITGSVIEIIRRENIRIRKKLKYSEKKLMHSNTDLEQFAYIASHDLQEPLRMVSSYLSLLEKRNKNKLDSESIEFLDFAVDGAHRMQKLINGLLTYSRVNTKELSFIEVDCEVVLAQTVKNLEVVIAETNANITHDKLPTIVADESQLIQLFQNLISNALKFCHNSVPKIHISVNQQDNNWILGFHDNGIGINAKYREQIFLIFRRLNSSREYKGSGIGLSVCKKIVERLNGKIWVESEEGKGTIFWVMF